MSDLLLRELERQGGDYNPQLAGRFLNEQLRNGLLEAFGKCTECDGKGVVDKYTPCEPCKPLPLHKKGEGNPVNRLKFAAFVDPELAEAVGFPYVHYTAYEWVNNMARDFGQKACSRAKIAAAVEVSHKESVQAKGSYHEAMDVIRHAEDLLATGLQKHRLDWFGQQNLPFWARLWDTPKCVPGCVKRLGSEEAFFEAARRELIPWCLGTGDPVTERSMKRNNPKPSMLVLVNPPRRSTS